MMPRKLTAEESREIKKKSVMLDYHSAMRWFYRLNFKKVEDVIEQGEIWQEGKHKFRAVLPVKRGKLVFVIFHEFPDYLQIITVGITSRSKIKWG